MAGQTDVMTTVSDDVSWYVFDEMYEKIAYVTVPLLFVVGLVGNSVSVCVMLQPAFRKHNIRYFIAAMAVCDNFNLIIQLFKIRFVVAWLPTDHRDSSDALCKTFFFFNHFFKYTSGYCITVIAIERFVAVHFPMRARQLLTTRNLIKLTAALSTILVPILVTTLVKTADISDQKCVSNANKPSPALVLTSE